jgi:hypothetical protein
VRRRLVVIWSVVLLVCGIAAAYSYAGELFSPSDDNPSQNIARNTCGTLPDILNYTRVPVRDGDNPPWAMVGQNGPEYDVKLRDGCVASAQPRPAATQASL